MAELFMKLKRSHYYNTTTRHQVVKTVCERWDKACLEEDNMIRPIHGPQQWKLKEQWLEKERKVLNWHQTKKDQISAPLILDPIFGGRAKEMKEVCSKFEAVTGMYVVVKERAGQKNKSVGITEPLKSKICGRENCFPYNFGGGNYQKNSSGYSTNNWPAGGAGGQQQQEKLVAQVRRKGPGQGQQF